MVASGRYIGYRPGAGPYQETPMSDDRYQFQPWYTKAYRWLRWKPWFTLLFPLEVLRWVLKGCPRMLPKKMFNGKRKDLSVLWSINRGRCAVRMRHVWTTEEMIEHFKTRRQKNG